MNTRGDNERNGRLYFYSSLVDQEYNIDSATEEAIKYTLNLYSCGHMNQNDMIETIDYILFLRYYEQEEIRKYKKG